MTTYQAACSIFWLNTLHLCRSFLFQGLCGKCHIHPFTQDLFSSSYYSIWLEARNWTSAFNMHLTHPECACICASAELFCAKKIRTTEQNLPASVCQPAVPPPLSIFTDKQRGVKQSVLNRLNPSSQSLSVRTRKLDPKVNLSPGHISEGGGRLPNKWPQQFKSNRERRSPLLRRSWRRTNFKRVTKAGQAEKCSTHTYKHTHTETHRHKGSCTQQSPQWTYWISEAPFPLCLPPSHWSNWHWRDKEKHCAPASLHLPLPLLYCSVTLCRVCDNPISRFFHLALIFPACNEPFCTHPPALKTPHVAKTERWKQQTQAEEVFPLSVEILQKAKENFNEEFSLNIKA